MTMTIDPMYDTISVHQLLVEDECGDVVDVHEFCTDWCHQAYCAANDVAYDGWNGCHEVQVLRDTHMACEFCGSDMAIV